MKRNLKKQYWIYLSGFLIPVLIMILAYAVNGIYLNSTRSILASDAFTQGATFLSSFHDVLHGKISWLYNWNAGMGLSYLPLYSYYLGGIVTPMVGFFNKTQIPNAFYVLTIIKFGLAGLSSLFYLRQRFKIKIHQQLMLSTCYAVMAFGVVNAEQMMWLDVLYILPMVILGVDRWLSTRDFKVLFGAWFLMIITNFYMAFIVGLFTGFYYLMQLWIRQIQHPFRNLFQFAGIIVWSTLSGGVILFPLISTLARNHTELSSLTGIFTDQSGLWDLPIKSMVGAFDGTKFGTTPYIYVGLLILIYGIAAFFNQRIGKRVKLGYGMLLLLLASGFYLQVANLTWQGWHFPAMFLYRYSFLWSFVLIVLAAFEMEVTDSILESKVGITLGAVMMVAMIGSFNHYHFISMWNLVISLVFLLIYVGLIRFTAAKIKWQWSILLICLLEVGVNSGLLIYGTSEEWHYPSTSVFNQHAESVQKITDQNPTGNLRRLESLDPISRDDGIRFGYGSINFFSSVINRPFEQKMNQLGFKSRGSNLNMTYGNNTLIMDSILGIQDNLAVGKVDKYGFRKETSKVKDYHIYHNQNALNNALLVNGRANHLKFSSTDNLGNQNQLLNLVAGSKLNESIFTSGMVGLKSVAGTRFSEPKGNWNLSGSESVPQVLNVQTTVKAGQQAYLSLFKTQGKVSQISITCDGNLLENYNPDLVGQYVNLGYFKHTKTINLKISFNGATNLTLVRPGIVMLDVQKFQHKIDTAKRASVQLHYGKSSVKGTIKSTKKAKNLLLTIPFDPAWKARVNGKSVKVSSLDDTFCSIPLQKGTNQVELKYRPTSFVIGLWCTIIGLFTFLGVVIWFEMISA
jgi:uncharacterized membrane protein YfhO